MRASTIRARRPFSTPRPGPMPGSTISVPSGLASGRPMEPFITGSAYIQSSTGGAGVARSADADSLIAAWRTNNRATVFLVEHLPLALWSRQVPGIPLLTVRMIAAHIHNSRCGWIKSLGASQGVKVPRRVDRRRVRPSELVKALSRSSEGMIRLIEMGIAHRWPRTAGAVAELPDRPPSLPELLCCTRGTPPRPAMHGRASTGAAPPANDCRRSLAMDETIPRIKVRPTN